MCFRMRRTVVPSVMQAMIRMSAEQNGHWNGIDSYRWASSMAQRYWGGFTTQDLKRCRFVARITALTYNWWSLIVRLANPHQHTEAITSHPLLLHAPAHLTRHGGQTRITITHPHAEAPWVEQVCCEISAFFKTLRQTAEQFHPLRR